MRPVALVALLVLLGINLPKLWYSLDNCSAVGGMCWGLLGVAAVVRVTILQHLIMLLSDLQCDRI